MSAETPQNLHMYLGLLNDVINIFLNKKYYAAHSQYNTRGSHLMRALTIFYELWSAKERQLPSTRAGE